MLEYLLMLFLILPTISCDVSTCQCTQDHVSAALKAASHCKPIPKVMKLEMPGNWSFTQVSQLSL